MSSVFVEIAIVLLLILANGVFALSEIAVVSARKARLQERARRGSRKALAALELAESPGRFLSTVQIGITLVGILAGTFGGATLARHLDTWLESFPALAPFSEALSVGIVVLAITYLSLIVGELAPKRIGLNNPEAIAAAVAFPMRALSWLASPAVWVLERSSDFVLWLLRVRKSDEPPVTEDEIKMLIDQGTAAGIFDPAEREMVRRVFRLADRSVDQIMTPRPQIDWLNLNEPLEKLQHQIRQSPRSRFPVTHGDLEDMVGVVEAKKLLGLALTGETLQIEALAEKPLFVPESMKALTLLAEFKTAATHTAFVVDEYGSILGLVTPSDILEAVAGELPTLSGPQDRMVVRRDDGSWLLDGMLPVDELKETLGLDSLPGEETGDFSTLGGFVVTRLGRVPKPADGFEAAGFRFEVMDMDGRRVDKVLASPVNQGQAVQP